MLKRFVFLPNRQRGQEVQEEAAEILRPHPTHTPFLFKEMPLSSIPSFPPVLHAQPPLENEQGMHETESTSVRVCAHVFVCDGVHV